MILDYKKLIKSRGLRVKILRMLSFIPDRQMLKLQYRIKTGRSLNLKNPKRYTEKLQWYKLYYKDPLMVQCADKYEVRRYIEKCGFAEILNECYGIFDRPEDIDFDSLPDQFVMKDTLGGGGASLIIVKDKKQLDIAAAMRRMRAWVKIPSHAKNAGREWPYYSGKKHRIIVEKYIESDAENGGLIDYKFLCFGGKAEILYVLADRVFGQGAECGFFDLDFHQLPYSESDEPPLRRHIAKPENFDGMKRIAEALSGAFPCARVDLYNDRGRILFGEITFFDSSGYMVFEPDELDYKLGKNFKLHRQRKKI